MMRFALLRRCAPLLLLCACTTTTPIKTPDKKVRTTKVAAAAEAPDVVALKLTAGQSLVAADADNTLLARIRVNVKPVPRKRRPPSGLEMSKGFEDASQFGQENVEAMVASSKVIAKAAEEMNAEVIAFSKKNYEDSMAAVKEMGSVKSVSDFFEMQTSMAKTSFEGFVAEATKLNEMYAAAAKDAFAPINARFTAAADMDDIHAEPALPPRHRKPPRRRWRRPSGSSAGSSRSKH